MKAVILAGGKGTRLKPYTTLIPKPLVPVGDKAILEILINQLKSHGIIDITICVNHLAELIMAFFGNGEKFGVNIDYSIEEKPLSTVAPIKLIDNLPDNFLVLNGDLCTDIDFKKFYDYHLDHGSLLTVATYKRNVRIDFGVIEIDDNDQTAKGFLEKPVYNYSVSMGIYAFNKKLLDIVPKNEPFGFDNLMLTMLERKEKVKIFSFDGKWLDIGRPDDYEKAIEEFSS